MNPTALLLKADAAGVNLRAEDGELLCRSRSQIPEDLRGELASHKDEVLSLLRWSDEGALRLIRHALAYVAERYRDGDDLSALEAVGEEIDRSFRERDSHGLRVATVRYRQAAALLFSDEHCDAA